MKVQRPGAALANPRCAFRCLDFRFWQKRSENRERRHVAFLPWAPTPSAYEIQAAGVLRAGVRGRLSASRSAGVLRFRESTVRPWLSSARVRAVRLPARPPVRPLGRTGPAATAASRLSIGPRGRLRYTGRREGLGTGTYQCEPEPEFSSAAFRKAL